MAEHHTAQEDLAVWEDLDCTVEDSLGAGCSPEEADHNLEEDRRTAVVADRTAVVADRTAAAEADHTVVEKEARRGRRHSSHQTYPGHRELHHQALRESHRGRAVSLRSLCVVSTSS